jgi:hypothetical protein
MYQNIERSNINDSIFHFLLLEAVNYILKKEGIEIKQKLVEIDELGSHFGERVANHLLNNNSVSTSTKMEVDEIMKFLGRDVWLFLFGRQIVKLQTNRKGTFLIDCDELKFHHVLISDKNSQSETLENVLAFVSGIIKGILGTFNFECNVNASFKPGPIVNTILTASDISKGVLNQNTQGPFSYSFTISLLNMNI